MRLRQVSRGGIAATDTAILINKANNVWLYKTPNAVDNPLPRFGYQAAIILRSTVRENIEFVELYMDRRWESLESSEDADGNREV